MNAATALALAAMYLIPLGVLAWLFHIKPGYALAAIAVLAVIFGGGGDAFL